MPVLLVTGDVMEFDQRPRSTVPVGYRLRILPKKKEKETMEPLHLAIDKTDMEAIKNLVADKNIDLNGICKSNGYTALTMAVKKMKNLDKDEDFAVYEDIIELLLKAGCNVNVRDQWRESPIHNAAELGLKRVVELIMANAKTPINVEPVKSNTLLHVAVRGMNSYPKNPKADYVGCLDLFLERLNIDINRTDSRHNTALCYAVDNGDNETVLKLLRCGACVSIRNDINNSPLERMSAKTLETYLDECVTTIVDDLPNSEHYQINIDYGFLAYPKNSRDNEHNANLPPETDALLYMTQNEELRHLLKHPVITSFIYLKWQQLSFLFYANISFYLLLWLSLIIFILLGCGVENKQSDLIRASYSFTKVGLIIGLVFLSIREFLQLVLSPVRYLKGVENLLEIALICLTAWIVCSDSAQESTKRQWCAVTILLSSTELVLLIGKFHMFSTNIVMLKTVTKNFFKFLFSFFVLIIAFALSFYTLFREVEQAQSPPNTEPPPTAQNNTEKKQEYFFSDPGRALFKTIVMLTGEFEAGSLIFSQFPGTSHIIFIMFVFMIPIVLFNLLNGLAVSDIQEVRANAELMGHISRVKLISYLESFLIVNSKFPDDDDEADDDEAEEDHLSVENYRKPRTCRSWVMTMLQNMNSCMLNFKSKCIKPFANRICLFPHFLPEYRIIVKPNQDNKIEIPHRNLEELNDPPQEEELEESLQLEDLEESAAVDNFKRRQNYKLNRKIVQKAKIIISKRTKLTEYEEIKAKIESIETTLKEVLHKLESRGI